MQLGKLTLTTLSDGIGWKNRRADLRRIYELRERKQIGGMYTLVMLEDFEADVRQAAEIRSVRA